MASTNTEQKEYEAEESKNYEPAKYRLVYGLNDTPPWYLCIFLGLQHFFLSFGGIIGTPILLAPHLCIKSDSIGNQALANLICSTFFLSGITTVLQSSVGTRLPILQGSSFAFFLPTLALLALDENQCPEPLPSNYSNSSVTLYNDTDGSIVDGNELWMRRIRVVQGSMIVASFLEVLLGATGAVSLLVRFIGPLTIVPTISLIGLDLFTVAPSYAQTHWGIAIFTAVTLILCSQYLKNVKIPFPSYNRGRKCRIKRVAVFEMFPVLIALTLGWILCWILTATDQIPSDPSNPAHRARADLRTYIFSSIAWFRVPYPFQWGAPVVSTAGVIGLMAGVIASIVESTGDYYACAKMCEAPPPPSHAINRGFVLEGLGCILGGVIGSGTGTTSYSENVAAIGITRVASRRALQIVGVVLIVFGCFGKVGGLFVTLPIPVIGGIFMVVFGLITAIGLSNLQYVDMNSPRNIFVVGFSLFSGLSISNWVKANHRAIRTGNPQIDQIIIVILRSSMLLGGVIAFFLDNTLPGTKEERGFEKWMSSQKSGFGNLVEAKKYEKSCYNLPFSTNFRFATYIPFLPKYEDPGLSKRRNIQATEEILLENLKTCEGTDSTSVKTEEL